MKVKVYSIYDKKALFYGNLLMTYDCDANAERDMVQLVNGSNTVVSAYPADFSLYCLGEFDNTNGSIDMLPNPRLVVDLNSLVVKDCNPIEVIEDEI